MQSISSKQINIILSQMADGNACINQANAREKSVTQWWQLATDQFFVRTGLNLEQIQRHKLVKQTQSKAEFPSKACNGRPQHTFRCN